MSLSDFVDLPEIRALLEPLLPREPIQLRRPLRVPAARNSGGLVGTAFDYAVRFELQRRHPRAHAKRWLAELSLELVEPIAEITAPDDPTLSFILQDDEGPVVSSVDSKLAMRWRAIVLDARAAVDAYLGDPAPSPRLRDEILAHALRLARIDSYYRVGWVDPEPELVDIRDVADLRVLVAILPWKALGSGEALWLNPNFADQSTRVGGADADIIMGDLLLDLKVVTKCSPRRDLRQLIGYLLLARAAVRDDPTFPTIARIGVYYARHGHLWTVPASDFIAHPAFRSVEKRFFVKADRLFRTRVTGSKPRQKQRTR